MISQRFHFFLTILLVIPLTVAASQSPESDQTTKVVLLGTGTPNADPERSGPCTAIVVNDTPYLLDFGPGVVRRAAAAHQTGIEALRVSNLKIAFVTHLHSDHTAGFPDLILTPWVLDRSEPLQVYGPKGLRKMTQHILTAYEQDIYMRLYGLEPTDYKKEGYHVIAHEIVPGIVYSDSNVTVEAFPVNHGSWPHAFGYKFRTPDQTIVISGDTAPSESIVEACDGCDILIHEVYSAEEFKQRAPEWQAYHARFHTSTEELAAMAMRAKPELLILYHQLFWGASEEELLEEIRSIYKGKVVSGKDLEVY